MKWTASLIVDFAKKSLFSSKRINTVPVVGFSRNKTLLVDSGQDSVVLAQAFDSSRFPLEQGESVSFPGFVLSCLTCTRRAVRLASSVSNSTSPCNERTWNAKGTDTIICMYGTRFQSRAATVLTGASYDIRSADFIDSLSCPALDDRRRCARSILMYKV